KRLVIAGLRPAIHLGSPRWIPDQVRDDSVTSDQLLQEFGFLRVELLLREDALGLEFAELFQRRHDVLRLDGGWLRGLGLRAAAGRATLQPLLEVLRQHLPHRDARSQAHRIAGDPTARAGAT